MSDPGNNLACN